MNIHIALLAAFFLNARPQVRFQYQKIDRRRQNGTFTLKSLSVVNGLRNKDVAYLIHSTWARNGGYFRQRVVPSIRTWMRETVNVFVMIEENTAARVAFRNCPLLENDNFTAFACPGEPTVILSRKCTEESIFHLNYCCKVEELVRFLAYAVPDVYKSIKYALVGDDDYYFRVDLIMRWLSYIERANTSHLPLISNGCIGCTTDYHLRNPNCTEIITYGWYGVNMFNRADKFARVSSAHLRFTRICEIWNVAQDISLGLWAWLLEFYHVNLPGVVGIQRKGHVTFPDHEYLRNNIVFHSVYSDYTNHTKPPPCDSAAWLSSMRYKQNFVIGCGSLEHPPPGHDRGMNSYQLWQYFSRNISNPQLDLNSKYWVTDPSKSFPIPLVRLVLGYNQTQHYRKYNIVEEWHDYGPNDCEKLTVKLKAGQLPSQILP